MSPDNEMHHWLRMRFFIDRIADTIHEYDNEFDLAENFDEFGEIIYDDFVAMFGEIAFQDDVKEE